MGINGSHQDITSAAGQHQEFSPVIASDDLIPTATWNATTRRRAMTVAPLELELTELGPHWEHRVKGRSSRIGML